MFREMYEYGAKKEVELEGCRLERYCIKGGRERRRAL